MSEKQKKQLTKKQLDALARGRAKRMENIKNGVKTERKKKINTKSDDYLAGLIRGIELDRRVVRLEYPHRNDAYDELDARGYDVENLPYQKYNVKEYEPKKLSQKQLDALARGREKVRINRASRKERETFYDQVD